MPTCFEVSRGGISHCSLIFLVVFTFFTIVNLVLCFMASIDPDTTDSQGAFSIIHGVSILLFLPIAIAAGLVYCGSRKLYGEAPHLSCPLCCGWLCTVCSLATLGPLMALSTLVVTSTLGLEQIDPWVQKCHPKHHCCVVNLDGQDVNICDGFGVPTDFAKTDSDVVPQYLDCVLGSHPAYLPTWAAGPHLSADSECFPAAGIFVQCDDYSDFSHEYLAKLANVTAHELAKLKTFEEYDLSATSLNGFRKTSSCPLCADFTIRPVDADDPVTREEYRMAEPVPVPEEAAESIISSGEFPMVVDSGLDAAGYNNQGAGSSLQGKHLLFHNLVAGLSPGGNGHGYMKNILPTWASALVLPKEGTFSTQNSYLAAAMQVLFFPQVSGATEATIPPLSRNPVHLVRNLQMLKVKGNSTDQQQFFWPEIVRTMCTPGQHTDPFEGTPEEVAAKEKECIAFRDYLISWWNSVVNTNFQGCQARKSTTVALSFAEPEIVHQMERTSSQLMAIVFFAFFYAATVVILGLVVICILRHTLCGYEPVEGSGPL